MSFPVVLGDNCTCTFGASPCPIAPTGQVQTLACNKPMATIMDKPVPSFGMCSSMSNPAVAAATAAAQGVLTPQPCTPVTPAPWAPGTPTVLVGGKPALNSNCKLTCLWAGVISPVAPTVVTVKLP